MVRKLAILCVLLAMGCYFLVAVAFMNRPERDLVCYGVEVVLEDSMKSCYLKPKDVQQLLKAGGHYPLGERMDDISLTEIEELLAKHPYIKDATGYKTPKGKICVLVQQHVPMLYVMADNGSRFCINEEGEVMSKTKYAANLLVATGPITQNYALEHLYPMVAYIHQDAFWEQQIQQIHVLEDGSVELVPRVGKHRILLGQPVDVEGKLERMKQFYSEGLQKTGWNKYSLINLKYENQIICKKR